VATIEKDDLSEKAQRTDPVGPGRVIDRLGGFCFNAPHPTAGKQLMPLNLRALFCALSLLPAVGCGRAQVVSSTPADAPGPETTGRRVQGDDNLELASTLRGTRAYELAGSIARVESTADGYGYCSAIRVGKTLFMTNQHCARRCNHMRFRLGYEDDRPFSYHATFLCRSMIVASEPLDYALFRVEVENDTRLAVYPAAVLASTEPSDYEPAILASHPLDGENGGGRRFKEIDRSNDCRFGRADVFTTGSGRRSIEHYCDSDVGSSGAALFDPSTGRAVALHWGGTTDAYNMAIPMSLIVDDIRQRVEQSVLDELTIGP
jgi:hypothetical protein